MTCDTMILGALLAGGQSRRFGSDKAMALVDGEPMIGRVIAALAPQVDTLVICGREWPGLTMLHDHPTGGAGPLAGLNAALRYADERGYAGILAVPIDVLPLPTDLRERLAGPDAAVFEHQHAVGYWPTRLASLLDGYLAQGHRRIDEWITLSGARRVAEPFVMRNINRPVDLD